MSDTFFLLKRTGGNSWSTGSAPPPPPGQKAKPHTRNSDKESGKSGLGIGAIAGILLGVLLLLSVIIALLSRKKRSSSSSHFIEEDKFSRRQTFTPLASQELSSSVRANMQEDFRGNFTFGFPIHFYKRRSN